MLEKWSNLLLPSATIWATIDVDGNAQWQHLFLGLKCACDVSACIQCSALAALCSSNFHSDDKMVAYQDEHTEHGHQIQLQRTMHKYAKTLVRMMCVLFFLFCSLSVCAFFCSPIAHTPNAGLIRQLYSGPSTVVIMCCQAGKRVSNSHYMEKDIFYFYAFLLLLQ